MARRRKAPLAVVITAMRDVHAAVHLIAEVRARLGEAEVAPNARRRAHAFERLWFYRAEAQRRIDVITTPGLRKRRAELQRELDALSSDASAVFHEGQRARGGEVVSLAEARARHAVKAGG